MNWHNLLFLAAIFAVYILSRTAVTRVVKRIGIEKNIAQPRIQYVTTSITFALTLLAIAAASVVVGIGYQDLGLILGSVVAVFGIALVAQWSILSNVTASIIVFFFFPYRVGNKVMILDGENTIEGLITEITLFHVILLSEDDSIITFPNAMAFQKAVKIMST